MTKLVGQSLELKGFLHIAIGLTQALREVHSSGLIHKDIKPANILVDATGRVRITGFGIASRQPRERQAPVPPEIIAGTLAYMAPEQTGRMNRSIDARSDLYSLGVVLYELLTGAPPFTASDPMELVHCHIARKPSPPDEHVGGLPRPVADIVLNLLAKNAEDRYQTAASVESDLQRCQSELETLGRIDPFPLAAHRASDRLLIPEKLYGREREIGVLLTAFDRVVTHGGVGLMLVSGYSGIGKSSVVNELHRVLVPPRGLFAAGKFDQYKRGIPYATLAQAFQALVRGLLIKSEAELGHWRQLLLEALGPNGQLMVNLIPELALIIGEQLPAPDLPPQDAQRRFQVVFGRFLAVFARPEHPLALFLDDLQWLDTATLELLEHISTDPDARHLMLVGAYRDNEVTASHPLMRILESLRRSGQDFQEIVLTPLASNDVERLVADCLHAKPDRVQPLAELVFEKTQGNPFFVIQFVIALEEQGLLTFDSKSAVWDWDLARIKGQGFTDNVVDLMAMKLDRLPPKTQDAIKLFACLGNATDIPTLALIYERPEQVLHAALEDAVRAGLVFRLDTSYAFVHDRVHEAAYALIDHQDRPSVHLNVGRILVSHLTVTEIDDRIFEIVDQFNRGASLIELPKERERAAELNLLAGKRAKEATAYSSALMYLATGRGLFADDCWDRHYRLLFDLEIHRSECEYLTNELATAENRLSALLERATTLIDRAAIARQQMALYTILDRIDRAVEAGLEFLTYVGIKLPPHPTNAEVEQEFDQIWKRLGDRSIEQLFDLPPTTDPDWCATIDVMATLDSPALFYDNSLGCLIIGRIINLSLEHGHADGSCFAYVYSNLAFGCRFGDYRSGFRFAQLGFDLVEKRKLTRFKPRVYLGFAMANSWIKHLSTSQALLRRAIDIARESGDLVFMGYALRTLITNLIASGTPLAETQREAENSLEFARKARFGVIFDIVSTQLGLIRTLRGHTSIFGHFDDSDFDEIRFEKHLQDPRLEFAACWYWVRKLQARYYAGDYASAIQAETRAYQLLAKSTSFRLYFEAADYHFYGALARAASCKFGLAQERPLHLEMLLIHHKQLKAWAEYGPENLANRMALVEAEIASLDGRELEAEHLYEDAVRSARQHGFVQNEGVASELAARFHAERGFDTIAKAYLRNARTCYHSWGAQGKVSQLEQSHPHLRSETTVSSEATIGAPIQHLDLATVIKVSQAVSGDIDLKKLIDTIMIVTLEHTGAERGLLILQRADEYGIEAVATTGQEAVTVSQRQASITSAELPESVLRYVIRTHEAVIIDDASVKNPFSMDDYIAQRNIRSALCLPLLKQTKLIGILYLENNLTPYAFTPSRIGVLRIVASQAAISLENARLYAELQYAEAYLAEAQRISHTGSFGWGAASGKLYWSDETFRIFGVDRRTKPTLDLVFQRTHPSDVDALRQLFDRARSNAEDWAMERRLLMPDGLIKHVRVVALATKDELGDVEFVGTIMDITQSKQAEEALHKAQAELQRSARLTTMGELAATIAHEVKQPLAGMILRAESSLRWLNRAQPDIEKAKAAIENIAADGHRAGRIIESIRASFKKGTQARTAFDVNDLVVETLAFAHADIQRHQITVHSERNRQLPQINGDRVQLQQVLLNLITNAIESMSAVGDHRVLRVSSELLDSVVEVSVEDTGAGISSQDVERVFEPLFTTKPNGMGMGLSICRSIIEAHGGRLWATPRQPSGSAFRFTLPADQVAEFSIERTA
jgi:predicted ATPase/signal transduction histidine kinase